MFLIICTKRRDGLQDFIFAVVKDALVIYDEVDDRTKTKAEEDGLGRRGRMQSTKCHSPQK